MKKSLLVIALLAGIGLGIAHYAQASLEAYAFKAITRNSDNDGDVITFISPPSAGASAFLGVAGSPPVPQYWTAGTGLQFNGNTVEVGTIAESKVTNLTTDLAAASAAYEGTTQRTGSFPIFKSVTVGSGVAVFYLTADNTSGWTTLCTNGVIQDSVNVTVSDSTASYQASWAWTNSNKTLTVTTNKLTTANILTGVLGQAAANGSVMKLSVWCY